MEIKKEKKRTEKLSKEFAKKRGFNVFMTRYRLRKILEYCQGRETLLDVGCAFGKMTKKLSPFFKKIVAIDGSKTLIKLAKKENSAPNIFYQVSLIESLNLKEKFDVVLLSFILEHVAQPQKVLKKAARFLKDDGILFIMIPNAESLHRRVGRVMGIIKRLDELTPIDLKHGHRRIYNLSKITKEVKGAGLKINNKGTFFIKPLSNIQMEKIDPKICDALYEVSKDIPGLGSMIFISASKNMPRTKKAKIFMDLDGTILDVSERVYQVYKDILRRNNKKFLSKKEYLRVKRKKLPVKRILQRTGAEGIIKEFKKQWQKEIEKSYYLDFDKISPAEKKILLNLKKNYKLILVTLRSHPKRLLQQLREKGLNKIFDKILLTPGENYRLKWRLKYNLIKKYGYDNQSIIFGDTRTDILAGKKLKIKTVVLIGRIEDRENLKKYKPDFLVRNLSEFKNAILRSK